MTSTPLLRVRGLRVTTDGGDPLLARLDLDVAAGERVGIVGPSGAGKSLTVGAVLGLLPSGVRREGEVTWSHTTGQPGAANGALLQESASALNPLVRAGRQVGLPLHHLPRRAREQRVREIADELDLGADVLDRWPAQLSGGQRQRLALGMAMARGPALLAADEPTAALDAITQQEVATYVDRALTRRGSALLLVSHDLSFVAGLCSRLLVLDHGKVVEEGAVAEVLAAPKHRVTARLVEAAAVLGGAT